VPRGLLLLFQVVVLLLAVAIGSADATVRSKLSGGVRLTLAGRHLTAAIVADRGVADELQGHRVRAVCGATLDRLRQDSVFTTRRWPADARTVRFRFRRDVSERASWCLLEDMSGSDIVLARFFDAEPRRLVAKGSSPTGSSWRMWGWRGVDRQPCAALRLAAGDGSRSCFDKDAAREAQLSAAAHNTGCTGDLFVYGVASRVATVVRITLRDGTTVEASRYPRPAGSRVRAQYFLAVLPGTAHASGIDALDAQGDPIGHTEFPDGAFDC
jgi:hypothetical protein